MTIRNFIIDTMEMLVSTFPDMRVRYEDHFMSDSHFLEISPSVIFSDNKRYIQLEEEIYTEFRSKFPGQSLCFLTETSLVPLKNIDYVCEGGLYRKAMPTHSQYSPSLEINFSTVVAEVLHEPISYISDSHQTASNSIIIDSPFSINTFDIATGIVSANNSQSKIKLNNCTVSYAIAA